MNKEIFKVTEEKELKNLLSKGEDIHQIDESGYNLYFHLPIEIFPFLLENNVDINIKSNFGVSYLFSILDIQKLKYLLNNGLDKNFRLKNGKSPYRNADLKLTKFFLGEKIPFNTEDFSDSIIVQEYLMAKGILFKKSIEVTGVNLLNMSNDDFHLFSKNNKELLTEIIMKEDLLKKISLNKLMSLVNNKYNLKKFGYNIKNNVSVQSYDLEKIKALENIGVNFKFNEKNLIKIFEYKDKEVVGYLLEKTNNINNLLTNNFLNELLNNIDIQIHVNKSNDIKKKSLSFFVDNPEWIDRFDFPFDNKKLINYLQNKEHEFFSILAKKKIQSFEDKINIISKDFVYGKVKEDIINSLTNEEFEKLLKIVDMHDFLLRLPITMILPITERSCEIEWLAKTKNDTFLLSEILSKRQYLTVKNMKDYIPKLHLTILKNIIPNLIKEIKEDVLIEFSKTLIFLESLIYLAKDFGIDSGYKNIEELSGKEIETGIPVQSRNRYAVRKNIENYKLELLSSLEKIRLSKNLESDIFLSEISKKRI